LGTDPDQVKRKEEVVERRTLFERRCLLRRWVVARDMGDVH
jgi:hypothetical protein